MKDQLIGTWHTHTKMNYLLIDNTTDAGMQKSLSTRSGRTIYEQWVHIHSVRMQWFEICAKDIFKKYRGDWIVKAVPLSTVAEKFWNNVINNYTNGNYNIDHIGKYNRAIFKFNNKNKPGSNYPTHS